MPENPFATIGVKATPASAPASTPADNPFATIGAAPPTTAAPQQEQQATQPSAPENPFSTIGSSPSSGESVSSPDEVGASWYKKAWGWANKPLIDIDDALGRTGQASGVERGVNSLVSGLTSPLSIALTLGTLGAGGLVESGGMAILREAGLVGADALADVTKGAQILSDATKAGRSVEEGLAAAKAAGVNTSNLTRGLEALKQSDLGLDSLTSTGLVRRGGASGLRNLGVSAAKAEKVSAGLQALVNGGFTVQNAVTAAEMSPKVLDALRDGEYDKAAEYGIEALGTGALAGVGAHELASESGRLMSDAAAKAGLQVKPSETNVQLSKMFGKFDADVTSIGHTQKLWEEGIRKQYPKMSPERLERVKYYVESGLDDSVMARRHDILAEIANNEDRIAPENSEPVVTGMPPERVQELVSSKRMAETYDPKELAHLKDTYDPRKLTEEDKALAKAIVDKHNETLEQAQRDETLGEGVENYSTNIWRKEDRDNPVANMLAHDASSGRFATNTSMARARMFDSSFEGQLLGKKLAETDPVALAAHNANTFGRIKAAQDLKNRMLDEGVKASTGAPMFSLAGTAHADPETGNVFVNPDNVRSAKIHDRVIQGLRDKGDLDKLVKSGEIVNLTKPITLRDIQEHINRLEKIAERKAPTYDEQGNVVLRQQISLLKAVRDGKMPEQKLTDINLQRPDIYVHNPKNYTYVDHPILRGVKHVAQTPSGDNVFVRSDLLVHPEAADYVHKRLGVDNQGPAEGAIGKAALKINREGKGLLLFGSPFHVFQEGLRGLMTGVSPFGIEKWDLAKDPVLRTGVEHGLTLGKDYRGLSAFKDGELKGNSALLSKVPGINRIQTGMDHFLFDKYIPGLKARAYPRLVEQYRKAYPDWTDEKIASVAAKDTNERFGGINYAHLGRSAATQNWMKLVSLAPDWLEGEVRAIARPFGTEGKVARSDMLRAVVGLWTTARIINYLSSGNFHNEAPFGIAVKNAEGKDKVYSIRTLPTDMLHAVSDPLGFVQGRFSPLVKTGTQFVTGRDEQGHKLAKSNLAVDFLRSVSPIPAQTLVKAATGQIPEVSGPEQVARAAGLTVMPYKTEALKLADKLASNHTENGPVDTTSLKRHQAVIKLEDSLRSGKVSLTEIQPLRMQGLLSEADYKRILDNYHKTRGMTPEQALLYTRASRAPAAELLQIFDAGTKEEKLAILPIVKSTASKYIRKSFKDQTPSERMSDPVLARFVRMEARAQEQQAKQE